MTPLAKAVLVVAVSALSACSGSSDSGVASGENSDESQPPPLRGQWYRAPESAEMEQRVKALEGIGYAAGMEEATSLVGVLVHDEMRVHPGHNLYSSGHGPDAFLVDMEGNVLHRWITKSETLWPERNYPFLSFRKARLTRAGVLLTVHEGRGIAALDRDSKVLWTYDEPAHHDIREFADGTLYGLDRRARVIPEFHPTRPLLDDRVIFLTGDGEVIGRVSVLECLLASPYADELRGILKADIKKGLASEEVALKTYADRFEKEPSLRAKLDNIGDIFHCNSVRVIEEAEAAAIDGFEAGWFLLSIRQIDALVVLEINAERTAGEARWFKRGAWKKQHEALPLATGNILLFDNAGRGQGRSRVIEITPATGDIVWSWEGLPDDPLRSLVGGCCHRLPNGNTLVVESTRGTAYEVTPEGECVWVFASPHRAGEEGELVAFLPDVLRIAPREEFGAKARAPR